MSILLGEPGSKLKNQGHSKCEGITQQLGLFYNKNFSSSSIWSHPPTPPLWRDMPLPKTSCPSSHGQGFVSSGKDIMEPGMSCEVMPSSMQVAEISELRGDRTSQPQVIPSGTSNSPFSFGFQPSPPSSSSSLKLHGSSSSHSETNDGLNDQENPINRNITMSYDKGDDHHVTQETPYSLQELSDEWKLMLQSQGGVDVSLASSSIQSSSSSGLVFSKEVRQPVKHNDRNPLADDNRYVTPLHKQESSHQDTDKFSAIPVPESFTRLGTPSATFVFGSSPASGTPDVGFSPQRNLHASASGSMPRSSNPHIRVKKHSSLIKRRSSAAGHQGSTVMSAFSNSSMDNSCFSNSANKFNMGSSGTDCSQHGNLDSKNMDSANSISRPASRMHNPGVSEQQVNSRFGVCGADSQLPLHSSDTASDIHHVKHAQGIGGQFSSWHPFLQKEEGTMKNSDQARDSTGMSKGMPNAADKSHEKCEPVAKPTSSFKDLAKPSSGLTRKGAEGSKLVEFDLNSSSKLPIEELRERLARVVRTSEEVSRQKENQEPNFTFGNQKVSRPFVFGASKSPTSAKPFVFGAFRPQTSMKNALGSDDESNANRSSRDSKESKHLNHLVAQLGEKMASLGRSHENLDEKTDHDAWKADTAVEGIQKLNSSKYPFKEYGKEDADGSRFVNNEAASKVQDGDTFIEKNPDLEHMINELREQLAKLARFDEASHAQNYKMDKAKIPARGASDDSALQHAVKELQDLIARLGSFNKERNGVTGDKTKCFDGGTQQKGPSDGNAIEHAVAELSEKIANLGKAGKEDMDCSTIASEHSVEQLCERMMKLGEKVNEMNVNQASRMNPNQEEVQEAFVFTASKSSKPKTDSSGAHVGNNSFLDPLQRGVFSSFSHSKLFSSNYSGSVTTANPFSAGQCPPFTAHNGAPTGFSGNIFQGDAGKVSSHEVFEFHGSIKGPLIGKTIRTKSGRAFSNMRRHENKNATGPQKSPIPEGNDSTSGTEHMGSPMEFSPCAAPRTGLDELQKAYVQSFKVESSSVEELRAAASNLTIGKEDKSINGSQQEYGSSEHLHDCINPFILRQRKGTWKRAPRRPDGTPGREGFDSCFSFGSSVHNSRRDMAEGLGKNGLSGERFKFVPFSSGADLYGEVCGSTTPVRMTAWSQGSMCLVHEDGSTFSQKKVTEEQSAMEATPEIPTSLTAMKSAAAVQVCEKWRLRGNQAYEKGDYEKAEDCYSRGVGSVSPDETSKSCLRASMLCYSNRAATRMVIGRMREALADCRQAMILDPSFLRVRLRAASCHLSLGESEVAAGLFADCLKHAKDNGNYDLKIVEDATEGARKSQQVEGLLGRALMLSKGGASTDTSAALRLINEALVISPYSEKLLASKAQILFSLRSFEEVLQLCQQSLPAAEENHAVSGKDIIPLNLWRWRMCGKVLFHLGRLEESLSLLTKHEEVISSNPTYTDANTDTMAALVMNILDLLKHKAAGNEAFQAGRHAVAVEHYTTALACNGESRPYNAVCFCNRAAASQALGHIADAIADCSRAIVLDPQYVKAISRRATLHEMIQDFGQTCNDLGKLIGLLESQESHSKSPKLTRAGSRNGQDLRQARDRLEKANNQLRKGHTVDHYLILGLDVSSSSNDIKKAYRKLALKHHPDKAGQFLARGENGDDGRLWKDAGDEVLRDAERLFKLIGESYAVLSDPLKRAQYDAENYKSRARNATKAGFANTEDYSPQEKTGRRGQRYHRHAWDSQSEYQRWQNEPDAAQPDTYSERSNHRSSSNFKTNRNRAKRTDYYGGEG